MKQAVVTIKYDEEKLNAVKQYMGKKDADFDAELKEVLGKMYEKYAELRDSKEITDYRVASDTGITKSTFTDWKRGRSKPKAEKLKILADYFGVSVEYFLE